MSPSEYTVCVYKVIPFNADTLRPQKRVVITKGVLTGKCQGVVQVGFHGILLHVPCSTYTASSSGCLHVSLHQYEQLLFITQLQLVITYV